MSLKAPIQTSPWLNQLRWLNCYYHFQKYKQFGANQKFRYEKRLTSYWWSRLAANSSDIISREHITWLWIKVLLSKHSRTFIKKRTFYSDPDIIFKRQTENKSTDTKGKFQTQLDITTVTDKSIEDQRCHQPIL